LSQFPLSSPIGAIIWSGVDEEREAEDQGERFHLDLEISTESSSAEVMAVLYLAKEVVVVNLIGIFCLSRAI